jgi:hypothetical protein
MPDIQNNQSAWWAQVLIGAGVGAMVLRAVAVDYANNAAYGESISPEMAAVMSIAAIAVAALPAAAALRGWSPLLRLGTAIAVATTVWAAANAYTARQNAEMLHAMQVREAYEAAQRASKRAEEEAQEAVAAAQRGVIAAEAEAKAAHEDAAKASTGADAATLRVQAVSMKKAADEADAIAKKKGVSCQERAKCRDALRDLSAVQSQIAAADGKDKALAREAIAKTAITEAKAALETAKAQAGATIAAAQTGLKAGTANAGLIAVWISDRTDANAENVARSIALAMTALSIVFTQIVALLGHFAVRLMAAGFGQLRSEMVARRTVVEAAPLVVEVEAVELTDDQRMDFAWQSFRPTILEMLATADEADDDVTGGPTSPVKATTQTTTKAAKASERRKAKKTAAQTEAKAKEKAEADAKARRSEAAKKGHETRKRRAEAQQRKFKIV